jgi:hypothetical protein
MKTTGALWNAYLASWPDGQWFDDSDETFDGKEPTAADAAPSAVVEFRSGSICDIDGKEIGQLVPHFRKWLKAQSTVAVLCEVQKDKADELAAFVKSLGGKVIA